jgi:lysosomal acid lipase/cholesteryl ester hydrolase
MIAHFGYPVQNMTVETEDGYLLDIVRIPGGVEYKQTFESQQHHQGNNNVKTGKPVVFLMHGLLSTCEDFVIGGPTEGLAFFLADRGYDVFMGNARGSNYARKHTTLNPEKDAAFWKFCWSDIGKKDLPAMIDEILRISGESQLRYIGHMQGSTVFYVMASERPEYNNKIEKMISMGPMAYMKNADNEMYRTIAEHAQSKAWLLKNLGANEFHPSNEFMSTAGQETCISRGVNERICQNPYFLINGYESDNMNMTTAERYAQRLPAGASTRQVLHFAQIYKSGRFEKYSEEFQLHSQQQPQQQQQGQKETEEYQLENISCPMYIVYSSQDKISSHENVEYLKNKLPQVVRDVDMSQCKNNMDLLFARNVRNVYETVSSMLNN